MQPFQGITVVDLTHVFAGPFCGSVRPNWLEAGRVGP